MRTAIFLVGTLLIGILAGAAAVADPLDDEPTSSASLTDDTGDADTASVGDVVASARNVLVQYRQAGILAAITALTAFLIRLLRFGPVDKYLTRKKLKKYKPIAAAILGGLLAALTTAMSGEPILFCVIDGIIAGLGATGIHQIATRSNETRLTTVKEPG